MDISKLSHGAKIVLGAGIVFFVTSFFKWFKLEDTSFGENMWHGVGFLAGLILLVLVVWQAIRLANIEFEIGVSPSMVTAALSVLLVIFTLIRFLDKPGGGIADSVIDRTIWAWLGLVLSVVIVVGAWMNMQAAGEHLGDMRDRMAAAAGATEAAKSTPETPAEQRLDTSPSPSEPVRDVPVSGTSDTVVAPEGDDEPRQTA